MDEVRNRHKFHMLTYAIDSSGNLVNIDEVKPGRDCSCLCPMCKEPLIAKNKGQKLSHHFAHWSGRECIYAYESMLHLLAKAKIQAAFVNAKEFMIDFEYKSYCYNEKKCKYWGYSECFNKSRKKVNLKDYYDMCEQEFPYDSINRRSDLKLFSSTKPKREPVYIEFFVTHASDEVKLNSGNRIIECLIESEDDINNIVLNGFVEEDVIDSVNEQNIVPKTKFYGFKNKDYNNKQINREIEFSRFVLYKTGKMLCSQESCNCKKLKRSKPYSLWEICFHTPLYVFEYAKYIGFKKFHIPNCYLCENYVNRYDGNGMICRLYKKLQIPRVEKFDSSRAKSCSCFSLDQTYMERIMKNGCDIVYEEL